jgi:glycosyltransferase involved in cell wall biosynthesis
MDVLLRVFAALRRDWPSARLIRVGGAFTEQQAELSRDLGVEGSVTVLPFLTSPTLAAIYRRASLMLQPSESEGFGMPLPEALACGCPVLASDIPSLREVGGGVCSYGPVGNVEAWEQSATQILKRNQDQAILESWRKDARIHAAQYSWDTNARQTVEVYEKVLFQQK